MTSWVPLAQILPYLIEKVVQLIIFFNIRLDSRSFQTFLVEIIMIRNVNFISDCLKWKFYMRFYL